MIQKNIHRWNFKYHNATLPQYNTHLRSLNNKQSKLLRCFNITILYFFLFTRKFRQYLFPKGVLIYEEKATPRSNYFPGNYDRVESIFLQRSTEELSFKAVYIYSDNRSNFSFVIPRNNLWRLFNTAGIPQNRVEFHPNQPRWCDHHQCLELMIYL